MSKVASYDVINDAPISLAFGVDIDRAFPIQLGSGVDVGIRSVLSYQFGVTNPDDLKFQFTIVNGNGVRRDLTSPSIGSNIHRVFQEVVDANVLTPSGNKLVVTLISGSGTLELSDIVLWYFKTI